MRFGMLEHCLKQTLLKSASEVLWNLAKSLAFTGMVAGQRRFKLQARKPRAVLKRNNVKVYTRRAALHARAAQEFGKVSMMISTLLERIK